MTQLRPLKIARTSYPTHPAPSFEAWRRWITTGEDWLDEVAGPTEEELEESKFQDLMTRFAQSLSRPQLGGRAGNEDLIDIERD